MFYHFCCLDFLPVHERTTIWRYSPPTLSSWFLSFEPDSILFSIACFSQLDGVVGTWSWVRRSSHSCCNFAGTLGGVIFWFRSRKHIFFFASLRRQSIMVWHYNSAGKFNQNSTKGTDWFLSTWECTVCLTLCDRRMYSRLCPRPLAVRLRRPWGHGHGHHIRAQGQPVRRHSLHDRPRPLGGRARLQKVSQNLRKWTTKHCFPKKGTKKSLICFG